MTYELLFCPIESWDVGDRPREVSEAASQHLLMPHENVLCSWSLTGASREPRKPAAPRNRPDGRLESARASEDSSKLGLCRSRSLHPSGVSAARRDTKVSRKVTKHLSHPRTGERLSLLAQSEWSVPGKQFFRDFSCDFRVAGLRHNPEDGNVEAATGEAELRTRRRLHAPNRRRRFAEVPRFRVPREAPRGSTRFSATRRRPLFFERTTVNHFPRSCRLALQLLCRDARGTGPVRSMRR